MPEATEQAAPPLRTWRPMAAGSSVVAQVALRRWVGSMAWEAVSLNAD